MVALVAVHVVLSCILTAKAIKTWKVTGAPYLRENTLFWARRISGIAVMLLLAFHVLAFRSSSSGSFTLSFFGGFQLAANILGHLDRRTCHHERQADADLLRRPQPETACG